MESTVGGNCSRALSRLREARWKAFSTLDRLATASMDWVDMAPTSSSTQALLGAAVRARDTRRAA